MRTLRSSLPANGCSRGGFALLITVTLLAFIVVLLVGLAAYTRVETAVAGNSQRQAQARENALLAMNVALGQLQRHAGPDTRVTATAAGMGALDGTRHYTGVWSSARADGESVAPLTWLVSGNERNDPESTGEPSTAAALAVTPATPGARTVELAGRNITGNATRNANSVVAPLVDLTATGIPGTPPTTDVVIGRYAWWVGDQGVKAAVAVSDDTDHIDYAPYVSSGGSDLRERIRQQVPLGAAAADATGNPVFEPRANGNAGLVADGRVTAFNQIAFLRGPGNAPIGFARAQPQFHTWSPDNFAVLANTRLGGLRQDLSLFSPEKPSPLGPAFDAWANYSAYTEDPAAAGVSAYPPLPEMNDGSLRRRHAITPALFSGDTGVAPVLTHFHMLFGIRKQNATSPYTLSLRWAAALWNPYTSALVPEPLRLEISGLPQSITITYRGAAADTMRDDVTVDLRELYGEPLKVTLPWGTAGTSSPAESSWLPGRVYNWTFSPGSALRVSEENPGRFDSRDLGSFANGLSVVVPGSRVVNGNTPIALRVAEATTLTVKLVRDNGDALATYTSPTYDAVPSTAPDEANQETSQLGFVFRLAEGVDRVATPDTWLTTAGRDPRSGRLPGEAMVAVPHGTNPAAYRNFDRIRAPERLWDRDVSNGASYNEDVPLFELPRSPLLTLGMLQHVHVPDARPFSIGNSWGSSVQLNGINAGEIFDRFYFSGLARGVTPNETTPRWRLPNPLLKRLRNPATGMWPTAADLRADEQASARYLLQGGAFNLNSTNPAAWAAVLRSVRFPAPVEFTYLDADPTTGTAESAGEATLSHRSSDAHFFRFPQSAQEVFKADDGYVQSTTGSFADGEVIAVPAFRRGMKTLTAAQISAFAAKIAEAVAARHAAQGPFRSVEEFLGSATAGGPSLIEQAIIAADTGGAQINVDDAGNPLPFSSQYLTQADVLTALAPILFPRSDTFLIRAYGEAVNPATSAVEGRAWCEALVQRVPEYFDATQGAETPPEILSELNQRHGRRFKLISFRWLTRSDI